MNGLDYGSMRLWQRKLQQSERTVDQFIQKFLLEQALEARPKPTRRQRTLACGRLGP